MHQSFKESSAIFDGKIISVRDFETNYFSISLKIYSVQVENIYKGRLSKDTIEIISGLGDGDCGFLFEIGQKYILYCYIDEEFSVKVNLDPKSLSTDICKRTKRASSDEINEIKKYKRKHLFWWI
jgi:hypothetical protein